MSGKKNWATEIPQFDLIDLNEAWGDTVIYTTFQDAAYMKNMGAKHKKVFYLWDLDWHSNNLDYFTCKDLLEDADELYCRCQSHADQVHYKFGIQPKILERFEKYGIS